MCVPVQPQFIRVIDENSKDTLSTGATLGPINEDSTIALYCESGNGKPVPTVEWFKDDQLLEGIILTMYRIFSPEDICKSVYTQFVHIFKEICARKI